MNVEHFERDIKNSYKNIKTKELKKRISELLEHISKEWGIKPKDFTTYELRTITSAIIDKETKVLHDELEDLLATQERIERKIDKATYKLQHDKYEIFNDIEDILTNTPPYILSKLHKIKFQSIDLFDILSEMVESAFITTLEKNDTDIEETLQEIIKDITYETLNEGPVNAIRIRKILTTILQTATGIAEASPNQAEELLRSTLKGMKVGVIKSITKFKQNLLNTPDEVKSIIINDYENTINELKHIDILFTQVVTYVGDSNTKEIKQILNNEQTHIKLDLQELMFVSKETVAVLKDKFSHLRRDALEKSSKVLQSQKAQEAKRMGKQAWSVAKTALGSAIKTAKNAIDKKDK